MKIKGISNTVKIPIVTKTIQIDDDNEYKWRATRIDLPTMSIIVCEWMHPNQGFWWEDCIWYLSMHMKDWECVNIAETREEWKNSQGYLKSFPQFKKLFVKRNFVREMTNELFKMLESGEIYY